MPAQLTSVQDCSASLRSQTVLHVCGSMYVSLAFHLPAPPVPASLTQGALLVNLFVAYSHQAPWSRLRTFELSASSIFAAFPGYRNGSFSLCFGPFVTVSECAINSFAPHSTPPPTPSPHIVFYISFIYRPPSMRI